MIQLPKWLISALIPVVYSATLGETTHSKGYDMPLKWNSFGYSVETSIGTPPQVITSAIDWTWNSHYIATTICLGSPTNTNCYPPGQQLFNQTLSSTFTNLSSQYADEVWNPNHFFFNLDVKVQYASDIQIIGSTKVNVRFQAADMQFSLPAPLPFEGVFGLSPVFNASRKCTFSIAVTLNLGPRLRMRRICGLNILASLEIWPIFLSPGCFLLVLSGIAGF